MTETIKAIHIKGSEVVESFIVEVVRSQMPAQLVFTSERLGILRFEGVDVFDAMLQARRQLERDGLLLLCNGARFDAYPSGMSRQMSSGKKLYIHKIGVPGRSSDVVGIFGEALVDQVGTVAQQEEYMQKWRSSIGLS